MEPIISIRQLDHYYGASALKKQVLFDINLDIIPGEIVIMTGPSGSGKTTLLTLLGGLRSVQSGQLRCLGHELAGAGEAELVAVRRHIGYIFQAHNLLPFMTARQNVGMSLEMHRGISRRVAQIQASEMLERVGLEERIHYYPDKLSGGQKQRVAIARALVSQPRLVLADEPTASLDKKTGRDVVDLMYQLVKQQGCTILLVTHDNRILDIADRIIHMDDGKLVHSTAKTISTSIPKIAIAPSPLPASLPVETTPFSLAKATTHSQPAEANAYPSDPPEKREEPDLLPHRFASYPQRVPVTQTRLQENNHFQENNYLSKNNSNESISEELPHLPSLDSLSYSSPYYPQTQPSYTHSALIPGLDPVDFAKYSPQSLITAGFSQQTIADDSILFLSTPPVAASKPYKILCIDTDTEFLNAVEQLLDREYFKVIAVDVPIIDLVIVLKHQPDLILLEVNLPNFNGYQLCHLLRQNPRLRKTPIIITTRQQRNLIGRLRAKLSGASGYLVKPLTQRTLATTVFPHIA